MSQTLSVIIVNKDDREREQLRTIFDGAPGASVVAQRADFRAGLALAEQTPHALMVVDSEGGSSDTLASIAQLKLAHPEIPVFLITDNLDADLLLKALRAGAQEVLRRPVDRVTVCEAIERVATQAVRSGAGARNWSVITVFSNRGGCGVSTLSTNLAVALRRSTGRETVLLDLDYHAGDDAFLLGLRPSRSLGDVLASPRLDSTTIYGGLTRHDSGLHLLSQPEHPDGLDGVTSQQIGRVIEILAATFDLIVVDAPHVFNGVTLEVFDRSTTILLVTQPRIPAIRAAHRSLEVFHRLNYTAALDRVKLILNRDSGQESLSAQDVSETLRFPVFHRVTNDFRAFNAAVNAGRPLCLDGTNSAAANDIRGLAEKLTPGYRSEPERVPAANGRRPSRFRLFGKAAAR